MRQDAAQRVGRMNALTCYVFLGALAAGFVQGLSGFAFGLVAMTFWVWAVAPQVAGPLVVFGSLVGQLLSLGSFRRSFDARRVWPFVLGGCAGAPIGVWLLHYVDPTEFKMAVGLILVAYCPLMLFIGAVPRITAGGRLADGGAGLIGGVMGGLGGLNGPAPTLWCSLRGWSRDEQRAIFQTFSLCMQALTLAIYAASGLITRETVGLFAIVAPAMVVPTLFGVRLYARFSEAGFRRLILILLSLSGIVLLIASVPRLLLDQPSGVSEIP
jgi:uncharacterized protein